MNIINLVLGVILLTTGKKLYWLFVAVIGFIIGLYFAQKYVLLNPPWLVYVVALGVGIIGAILATFLQHFAIALVGFIAGGYGGMYVAGLLGFKAPNNYIAFIVGGIVGLMLVASVFNWALYLLSAWAGATLVTEAIKLSGTVGLAVFFALFVLGVIIQAGLFREGPKKKVVEVQQEVQTEK